MAGVRGKLGAVAAGIAAVGLALRLVAATTEWVDAPEAVYDFLAHAPADRVADAQAIARTPHSRAYAALLRPVAAVGDDFAWLRLPAVAAGTAGVVAAFALGTGLAGGVAGGVAAAAWALSPTLVQTASSIGPAALRNLLLLLATLGLFRFLRDRRRRDRHPVQLRRRQLRRPMPRR